MTCTEEDMSQEVTVANHQKRPCADAVEPGWSGNGARTGGPRVFQPRSLLPSTRRLDVEEACVCVCVCM
ncbi:hypothetical protein E2C01_102150 [Portunus trituberculatus]|uniref:Uncharacterized protein n=1 Tax=Portunus trituberculatus TaxID=210409 RepID=A0A5B7KHL8_PORTR|nr:hypothetical protein [Portunus trituberculatus]